MPAANEDRTPPVDLEADSEEIAQADTEILRAAKSWIRKLVKDAYADDPARRFGVVVDVDDQGGEVRLLARFPGEAEPRRIALEPVPDGHYLYAKDVKARYRRLSDRDVTELKALSRRNAA